MQHRRFQPRVALGVLAVVGISAVGLYFGGDHRAGFMTAGETVFLACLIYGAWKRDKAGKS
jgi:hypothetical protein